MKTLQTTFGYVGTRTWLIIPVTLALHGAWPHLPCELTIVTLQQSFPFDLGSFWEFKLFWWKDLKLKHRGHGKSFCSKFLNTCSGRHVCREERGFWFLLCGFSYHPRLWVWLIYRWWLQPSPTPVETAQWQPLHGFPRIWAAFWSCMLT